jgi:hypothetical protein
MSIITTHQYWSVRKKLVPPTERLAFIFSSHLLWITHFLVLNLVLSSQLASRTADLKMRAISRMLCGGSAFSADLYKNKLRTENLRTENQKENAPL